MELIIGSTNSFVKHHLQKALFEGGSNDPNMGVPYRTKGWYLSLDSPTHLACFEKLPLTWRAIRENNRSVPVGRNFLPL
jgi:hypothetical protein